MRTRLYALPWPPRSDFWGVFCFNLLDFVEKMARMYRIFRYCNLQFADKYSKRTNTATSLTTESGHAVIHWLNLLHDYNMKWEMPKLLYEGSEVRNNVTLIILIALQVFQSIYLIFSRNVIIRLLQSIKTIVEYVVCWFLFKPPGLINLHYCTVSNKYRVSCSQKSFNFHRSMGVRSPWRNVGESTRQVILHSNHCKFFFFLCIYWL